MLEGYVPVALLFTVTEGGMADCPLCKLVAGNIISKLYFETDKFICVDCLTCGKNHPIVVLRRHDMEMTKEEQRYMFGRIPRYFGDRFVGFRMKEAHPEWGHLHYHVLLLKETNG